MRRQQQLLQVWQGPGLRARLAPVRKREQCGRRCCRGSGAPGLAPCVAGAGAAAEGAPGPGAAEGGFASVSNGPWVAWRGDRKACWGPGPREGNAGQAWCSGASFGVYAEDVVAGAGVVLAGRGAGAWCGW